MHGKMFESNVCEDFVNKIQGAQFNSDKTIRGTE